MDADVAGFKEVSTWKRCATPVPVGAGWRTRRWWRRARTGPAGRGPIRPRGCRAWSRWQGVVGCPARVDAKVDGLAPPFGTFRRPILPALVVFDAAEGTTVTVF